MITHRFSQACFFQRSASNRQPVILDPSATRNGWTSARRPRAKDLLQVNLDNRLEFHRVSRDVNSSRFDGKPAPEINPL